MCYNIIYLSCWLVKEVRFGNARVVKLVYTYALGAYAIWCAGSSPVSGTIENTLDSLSRVFSIYNMLDKN